MTVIWQNHTGHEQRLPDRRRTRACLRPTDALRRGLARSAAGGSRSRARHAQGIGGDRYHPCARLDRGGEGHRELARKRRVRGIRPGPHRSGGPPHQRQPRGALSGTPVETGRAVHGTPGCGGCQPRRLVGRSLHAHGKGRLVLRARDHRHEGWRRSARRIADPVEARALCPGSGPDLRLHGG
jgi:hypothetical protein